MRKIMFAALGAATMMWCVPATAQELPLKGGQYWDVAAISIDDGHAGDYADFLAGEWRKRQEFAMSKGWIKGYHILSNNNARDGEPDLYLVTIFDHVATPADEVTREKDLNAFLSQTTRQGMAGSAHRATFRKLRGDMLLQEQVWSR
jgi:hypothetical protein